MGPSYHTLREFPTEILDSLDAIEVKEEFGEHEFHRLTADGDVCSLERDYLPGYLWSLGGLKGRGFFDTRHEALKDAWDKARLEDIIDINGTFDLDNPEIFCLLEDWGHFCISNLTLVTLFCYEPHNIDRRYELLERAIEACELDMDGGRVVVQPRHIQFSREALHLERVGI